LADPQQIAADVAARLASHADAERAVAMSAYMRDQFPFFGVDAPTRKRLEAEFVRSVLHYADPFSVAMELWTHPQRECQYVAVDLLRRCLAGKRLPDIQPVRSLEVLEFLITHASWWDTVDSLAPNTGYPLLTRFEGMDLAATARRWIEHDNLWLQRSAILLQLKAKDRTNVDLLFELILRRSEEPEFFLRKGAGWALREYSKTDPAAVRSFLDRNRERLSPLTLREASKYC